MKIFAMSGNGKKTQWQILRESSVVPNVTNFFANCSADSGSRKCWGFTSQLCW